MTREDWITHSIRSRMVHVARLFPGVTPPVLWALPLVECWAFLAACDVALEEEVRAATELDQN